LGLGEGLITPHCENITLIRNVPRQRLGPELILWYGVSNEKGTVRKWDVGVWTGLSWLSIETGGGNL
jgi:hypothetical protein